MKRYDAPLFIDEADRIAKKSILIETVRDLHDLARIPIILVGSENLIDLLKRKDLGPVFSRVTEILEFQPLSVADIQEAAKTLCHLECHTKVASFIRTATLGDFRLLNTFLMRVENLCNMNGLNEITMSTAKEAAKAVPNLEGLNITEDREEIVEGGHRRLAAR